MTEDQYVAYLKAMEDAGRACRWYQRKLARDIGMTTMPGCRITVDTSFQVGPERFDYPPEDVTKLEPGEAEYLEKLKK